MQQKGMQRSRIFRACGYSLVEVLVSLYILLLTMTGINKILLLTKYRLAQAEKNYSAIELERQRKIDELLHGEQL